MMIGVSAEINSPSVITSMIWSPNFPFPLGRNVVIASPRVPGEIGRLVTNSRGALKDGPEGMAAMSANRREKLVRGRYRASNAITIIEAMIAIDRFNIGTSNILVEGT